MEKIHPSAKVAPTAIIGPNVTIEANVEIMPYSVIQCNTIVGEGTKIYPHAVVGCDPQGSDYKELEKCWLHIGKNNVIREFTTICRGSHKENYFTKIGDNNEIMAYSHVGHDCIIGNHTKIVNRVDLAGHVTLKDYAIVSGDSKVHQFVTIGKGAFVGGMSGISKNVVPYSNVFCINRLNGVNTLGLERSGVSAEEISALKKTFEILFHCKPVNLTQVEPLKEKYSNFEKVIEVLDFISNEKLKERGFPNYE